MTIISAPQLSISVPCLNCGTAVTVKASLTRAAAKSGIFCPDCLPSKRQATAVPEKWTKELYQDYLQSAHWKKFRDHAFLVYGRKCYLCAATDCRIDLHHNTYERLGGEQIGDVIPLCRDCHQGYEDWKRGI